MRSEGRTFSFVVSTVDSCPNSAWVYMSSLILIHIPSQTFYFYYFSRENQPAEDRYGDGRIKGSS